MFGLEFSCGTPTKFDWTETIKENLEELQIGSNLSIIKEMKKDDFSKLIKERCKLHAFNELIDIKGGHSKMKNLQYKNLEMQNYLKDKTIHTGIAKSLFRFRTRMVDVRNNFATSNPILSCPFDDDSLDDQQHLLKCVKLQTDTNCDLNYYNIFQNDSDKILPVITKLIESFEKRQKILMETSTDIVLSGDKD